jgi:hypothetical protein
MAGKPAASADARCRAACSPGALTPLRTTELSARYGTEPLHLH